MILGYITYFISVGIITAIWWIILFLGFLIGIKKEVDISIYFRAMFTSFEKSELRGFWKSLIFTVEYILGIYALIVVKGAWYPAQGIRWTIKKILFSSKRKK